MIYDTFLFFNELDVLDIRLHELDEVVDKFVLVEATVTHTNKKKPLYFKENKARFKKFKDKIIHIVVDDSPNVSMPWIIERHQLTAVERGLQKCKPNDIILYSCVDEIPKAEKILEWKDKPGKNKMFMQTLFCYYFNCARYNVGDLGGTHMFRFRDLKSYESIYLTRYLGPFTEIADGGWHFSYIGNIKFIQQKLASFAHQEFNNNKYNTPEKIEQAIIGGKDPFGFGWKFHMVDISVLPQYIISNRSKYKDLLASVKKEYETTTKIKIFLLELRHSLRLVMQNIRSITS